MSILETFQEISRTNKVEDMKKPIKSNSSLHKSIANIFILAQCFALMPLSGITHADSSHLKVKFLSFRFIYSLLFFCCIVGFLGAHCKQFYDKGIGLTDMVTIVYFSNILLMQILLVSIGRKWYGFIKEWEAVDVFMESYEYQPNLNRRFKITMTVFTLLALGEHLLSLLKFFWLLSQCSIFHEHPIRTFLLAAYSPFFALTSFSYWKGFIIEYVNISGTFAWNFMDLFVMCLCAAMAEKFRQINRRVASTKIHNDMFWKIIREDYNRLANLCKSMDRTITHLVSLCLMNDLFFITVQLFNSLAPLKGLSQYIYFIASFGFLLGRTAAVSLYAAWIHDESQVMLGALFNVPSEIFGAEADRLIQQITFCPVAITCSNFFNLTKDFCLKVAGTIITLEVVLQQIGPMILKMDDDTEDRFCFGLD